MLLRVVASLLLFVFCSLTALPKALHAAWSGGEVELIQTLPSSYYGVLQAIPARALGADGTLRDGLYLHVHSADNSNIALWFSDGNASGTDRIGETQVSRFSSAVWISPDGGIFYHGMSPHHGPALLHAQGPEQAPVIVNFGARVPPLSERVLGVDQQAAVFSQSGGTTTATLLGTNFDHREVAGWTGGVVNLEPEAINADSMYFYSNEPPLKLRRLDLASATLHDFAAPATLGGWRQSHQISASDQFVCVKENYAATSSMYVAYCENPATGSVTRVTTAAGEAIRQLDFGSNFRRLGSRMLLDGFEVIAGQQSPDHRLWSHDGSASPALPILPASGQLGPYCTAARDGKIIRSITAPTAGGENGYQFWQFDGTPEGSRLLADLPQLSPNCRGRGAWLAQRNIGLLDTSAGLQLLDANSGTMTAFPGFPEPVSSIVSIERVGDAMLIVTRQADLGLQIWRYVPEQIFAQGFD